MNTGSTASGTSRAIPLKLVRVKSRDSEYEVSRGIIIVDGREIGVELIKNIEKADESVLQRIFANGKEVWSYKSHAQKYNHAIYTRIIELPLAGFSVVVEYWGILEVLPIASILKGVKLPANERIRLKKYVADIRKEKPLFDKEEEALL